MTEWLPIILLFGGAIIGIVFGLPMTFTLGSFALLTALFFMGQKALALVATATWSMMLNLVLIAMPLFILMAAFLEKSGIAEDLYSALHQWLGPVKGGLSLATIVISTIIAAMTGITTTGVVTMGLIALPIMLKKGYDKGIAIGPILAGGALGILIPPSVSFIIYGMLTKTSIGKLFAGGVIPGLILAFLYLCYVGIRCHIKPHLGPSLPKEERLPFKEKLILSKGLVLPMLLIIFVLGSIFLGIASPTESAAIGAAGAIICTVIHRKMSWKLFRSACAQTLLINGMIMWILFAAVCFTTVFVATGGSELIKNIIVNLDVKPIIVILIMQLSLFILGLFINEITIMLITIPVFLPIIIDLGYSPIWFGIVFVVNMQMAYLTPPFGFTLFYMKGIAPPGISMADIIRSVTPFVVIQGAMVVVFVFVPEIVLWLPNMIFGL